jgi:hypothetical protein
LHRFLTAAKTVRDTNGLICRAIPDQRLTPKRRETVKNGQNTVNTRFALIPGGSLDARIRLRILSRLGSTSNFGH